jgi:hypothetical protein
MTAEFKDPAAEFKVNLTVDDLNKAADFYEKLIESIIKNPSEANLDTLLKATDALEVLGTIYDEITGEDRGGLGPNEDEPGDR